MKIRTTLAVVAVAAVAGVTTYVLSGVTGKAVSSTPTASPTQTAAAANPVAVLRQMHVPLSPGEVRGQMDIYGDRYASAQFPDLEQVTVYTYADQQAENIGVWRLGPPDDAHQLLVGDLFAVLVTGVGTDSGISFPESPAVLSQETGAKLEG